MVPKIWSMKSTSTFAIVIFMLSSFFANSQSRNVSSISLETNTTPLLFGGYALGINIKPKKFKRLGVLVGAAGNADFPGWVTDVFKPQNSDKNIDWEVRRAYVFAIDYYLKPNETEGLYLSWFNFIFQNSINRNELNEEFTSHTLLARMGYRKYLDGKNRFYINPWYGLGTEYKISGDNIVDNTTWETSDFAYFASLNVGFTF